MKSLKFLLPLAAIALSGIVTAAPRGNSSVVVRYADLNLNSQAGIASLHKRIRNAAESVCSELETRILGLRNAYDQCVDEAVDSGVAKIGNPALTQFHALKGKGQVLASN